MRSTIAAALLAAGLALAACDSSDKAEVHKAGTDLKAAGKATVGAVKDLASAAGHDLKSAGASTDKAVKGDDKSHPEKRRKDADTGQ